MEGKKILAGVPSIECNINGELMCTMNTVVSVSDFGNEIEISNHKDVVIILPLIFNKMIVSSIERGLIWKTLKKE